MRNKHRINNPRMGLVIGASLCLPVAGVCQKQAKQPNFVWFMIEDVAKHYLQIYNVDGSGAAMPHVEKMAAEGIVFNHAFCNAPVSSAARSTLFSGMYAPRAGMSWHRGLEQVNLPEGVKLFPGYLKEAGYYTYNSKKTDYNCITPEGSWDNAQAPQGEWRNRPDKDKPFFYVQTCAISHESCLHFSLEKMQKTATRHNPNDVRVAPNHPDTELFRYTYATFYDRIQDTDKELGLILQMLEEENELDDTFIFFFGDNGGALPGSKGYTNETGLHVPLVVYVPKNWRDKIDFPINSRANGFVSFLDFAPTLLQLAGTAIPEHLDGQPFLGKDISRQEVDGRGVVYGYGDRYDELYASTRTVRKGNFKYSRHFTPYQPQGFFAFYRYKMEAFRQWQQMYAEGRLTDPAQRRFFAPQMPEALYDISKDPYETNNLATDPAYRNTLSELRNLLTEHMIDKCDLTLLPEAEWLKAKQDPVAFGRESQARMRHYIAVIDLALLSFAEAEQGLIEALQSNDPTEQFWAVTTCIGFGKEAQSLAGRVLPLLDHTSPLVNSRAAVFQAILHKKEPATLMVDILHKARSGAEALSILGDMAYLKDYVCGPVFHITPEDVPHPAGSYLWRVEYMNIDPVLPK
ncbi:sulfatase, partial [Parabacteroides sp. OttesenSCG-928-K15]|nr:sulfatase [Parabacteroides sp. OttesenSCG-928-K15]